MWPFYSIWGNKGFCMDKDEKLRKNEDFRKIYNIGKSYGNRYLVIFFSKNNLFYNRVGFSSSKKVGNSVIRNKVKRRMREAYRLNKCGIRIGYDIIILARVNAKYASYGEIESALLHLIRISGLKKGE